MERINLFRSITHWVPVKGKRDGPMSGTEAFPVIGPRNGMSQKRLIGRCPDTTRARRDRGRGPRRQVTSST